MYQILIVEDDCDILEMLSSWLTEAGYRTLEAEDGLQALDVFEKNACDLVLLDLMLPKLDGFGAVSYTHLACSPPTWAVAALSCPWRKR